VIIKRIEVQSYSPILRSFRGAGKCSQYLAPRRALFGFSQPGVQALGIRLASEPASIRCVRNLRSTPGIRDAPGIRPTYRSAKALRFFF
jgi:hypothetical protein